MRPACILIYTIFALISTSCATVQPVVSSKDLGFDDGFISDVIGVKEKHLSPSYWTQPDGDRVILTRSEIEAFNRTNTLKEPTLNDVRAMPDELSRAELIKHVRSISQIPSYLRIYTDGTAVTDADFARYERTLNLDSIKAANPVRFGLAVKRTPIRTYPTDDLLFSHDAEDRDIERFQESTLFPGDPVAILHQSADDEWALIQMYNYTAWVRLSDIAIGTRDNVFDYADADTFLLITGDKVSTVYNPEVAALSELSLDMGVRVPLSRPKALQSNLYGQNPYLHHMILLPVREADGSLDFKHALIQRKADVHVGYLPYTQNNIIEQSFKFLGERYGWGHRFNSRDCTGFVLEIYKTFGIVLPRNSGDQRDSEIGLNERYDKNKDQGAKIQHLKRATPGDLVYIPGHVMMVLGQSEGEPFAIHDVHGMKYKQPDGTLYSGTLNGVSVTPIVPLEFSSTESYVDRILSIKTIR